MSENETIDSGIPLPRMASIKPFAPYTIAVKWADGPRAGREDAIDISPIIFSYKIYKPLREEGRFLTARLVDDDGDAVIWDGGDDLTMSADMIYALAEQIITPKEFATFLARNNLTQEAAAAHLGRSRRQIATYATTGPIPRIVAWACYGFDAYRRAKSMAEKVEKDEHAKNNKAA
ncbi:hypothetical protein I6F33_34340 [Bradyrhizobium sp. BRP20]|uniref:hypothetical protein n=1 Tax=unclassified Bradyrhizobium TaxID=2631580 RepID=UPI001CD5B9CF|nr:MULTISPECIES: hypothetical protein [unclassified Bradyrhizobium]MCA1437997.1 hypothetical protein [Bradyrhizobium sp. BRP20]MCA1552128.1 hypothetical protein [Bradyrhizobium sp. BRP19]